MVRTSFPNLPRLGEDPDEDDEPPALTQRQCADCGAVAPKTRTAHSLIGARHGWRVVRSRAPDGREQVQWRCPTCWSAYKER
jgi:hypothetical protein